VLDVVGDGARSQYEHLGDALVRKAAGDQRDNLVLARREQSPRRLVAGRPVRLGQRPVRCAARICPGDNGMRRAQPKPRVLVRAYRLAEGAQILDELGLAVQKLALRIPTKRFGGHGTSPPVVQCSSKEVQMICTTAPMTTG
jgi:hypothetical protein